MSGINHKTRQESGEGSKLNRGFWVKRVRKPKGNSEIQEADEQIFKGGGRCEPGCKVGSLNGTMEWLCPPQLWHQGFSALNTSLVQWSFVLGEIKDMFQDSKDYF